MKRILVRAVLFAILLLNVDQILAQQSKRLALVIGNAEYVYGGTLKNPVNDANLIASTLDQLGFDVIKKTDIGLGEMQTAFKVFAGKLSSYDVALFFYAGHGIQVNGENYLIPVDAKIENKMSLEFEAFEVSAVNKYFSYHPDKMNIMILDACRNNPYRSWARGGGEGFSAVKQQGAGTIIAFATREGETASDGTGNNGLFTHHLAAQMRVPQNITDVFQNTRIAVLKESNNQQVPQEWNMLTGNFYFTNENINSQLIEKQISDSKSSNIYPVTGTSIENFYLGEGSFFDERNRQTYKTIGIEVKQLNKVNVPMVWMAENIKFPMDGSYEIIGTRERLYTWGASLKVCPPGWHLPSNMEWQLLIDHFGGSERAGTQLRSTYSWNDKSWNVSGNGNNISGFNVLPYGYRNDFGTFTGKGKSAFFWTSTELDNSYALRRTLYFNDSEAKEGKAIKFSSYSCRCLLD